MLLLLLCSTSERKDQSWACITDCWFNEPVFAVGHDRGSPNIKRALLERKQRSGVKKKRGGGAGNKTTTTTTTTTTTKIAKQFHISLLSPAHSRSLLRSCRALFAPNLEWRACSQACLNSLHYHHMHFGRMGTV